MVAGRQLHGQAREGGATNGAVTAAGLRYHGVDVLALVEVIPGKNARQVADVAGSISVLLVARCVELGCTVGVELDQPDGEQLHHLACVVLVGLTPRRILFLVALGTEVIAHGRMQRHRFQQVAKIPCSMRHQRVPVMRAGVRTPGET